MVSAVKWEGVNISRGNILTTQLDSLANNTISALGNISGVNNTNLDKYGWLELVVTFTVAPSDTVPTIDIYAALALDGANFEDEPVTGGVDCGEKYICSIPVRKVTLAQIIRSPAFLIPPGNMNWYADNQSGQAFPTSGSTIELFTNNDESQ